MVRPQDGAVDINREGREKGKNKEGEAGCKEIGIINPFVVRLSWGGKFKGFA